MSVLSRVGGDPTLDEKVRFLADATSYGLNRAHVSVRETHMSWVFMTEDRVYKLKKPVRFAYLDFSTLERRAAACRAEYLLNRRLAPDVYLGVVPLTLTASGFEIDGNGAVADWLVVMTRLPDGATLEDALHDRRLQPGQVDRIAATLAAFYAHARRMETSPEHELVARRNMLRENCRVLLNARFRLSLGLVERIAHVQQRFLARRPELLVQRIRDRHFVDAHGDLRPEHIWLREPVTIIDCLEFDPHLRASDPLDEIAFLHLECERLGGRWAGERIRRRLARALDEDPSNGLFLFYRLQRATLRARLSIAHLFDENPRTPDKWPRQSRTYLTLAALDAARLDRVMGSGRKRPL
jgi:aminoglycoside phosphotransferase family enzyme